MDVENYLSSLKCGNTKLNKIYFISPFDALIKNEKERQELISVKIYSVIKIKGNC